MSASPEIAVFVATDPGTPLARRCIALWLDEAGELQPTPWQTGPSVAYCRQRLEARLLDLRAKGRDPRRTGPITVDPQLGQKLRRRQRVAARRAAAG